MKAFLILNFLFISYVRVTNHNSEESIIFEKRHKTLQNFSLFRDLLVDYHFLRTDTNSDRKELTNKNIKLIIEYYYLCELGEKPFCEPKKVYEEEIAGLKYHIDEFFIMLVGEFKKMTKNYLDNIITRLNEIEKIVLLSLRNYEKYQDRPFNWIFNIRHFVGYMENSDCNLETVSRLLNNIKPNSRKKFEVENFEILKEKLFEKFKKFINDAKAKNFSREYFRKRYYSPANMRNWS